MIGEFFVEKFVQKDEEKGKRFGIKTTELGESWINGFGECPQIIKENEVNNIPYHKVVRNGREYYNYGEEKPKLYLQVEKLKEEIDKLWDELGSLKNEIRN